MKLSWLTLWENGMVMAFDEQGAQVAELQGPTTEQALLSCCTEGTVFELGVWGSSLSAVPLAVWFEEWKRRRYYKDGQSSEADEQGKLQGDYLEERIK